MKISQLKQLIKEAIHDRLAMIDEAGNKAAIQAKIAKIEEDIQEAHDIKNAIPDNIKLYVDPEIVGDMMEDMAANIKELENKKAEYMQQLKDMEKPVKEAKKKPSTDMAKKGKATMTKKEK